MTTDYAAGYDAGLDAARSCVQEVVVTMAKQIEQLQQMVEVMTTKLQFAESDVKGLRLLLCQRDEEIGRLRQKLRDKTQARDPGVV